MKAQTIYNKVKRHLLKQGKRCEVNGRCRYSWRGMQCAVGALLTDDEIRRIKRKKLNDQDLSALKEEGLLPTRLAPHLDLLLDLQSVHDEVDDDGEARARWPSLLANVAAEQGLKP